MNLTMPGPFVEKTVAPSSNLCLRLVDPMSCPLGPTDEGRCIASEGFQGGYLPCAASNRMSRYRAIIVAARRRGTPLCVPMSAKFPFDSPACATASGPLCTPTSPGGPTQRDCLEASGVDWPLPYSRITSGTVVPGPGSVLLGTSVSGNGSALRCGVAVDCTAPGSQIGGLGHHPTDVGQVSVFAVRATMIAKCGNHIFDLLTAPAYGSETGANLNRKNYQPLYWPYAFIAEAMMETSFPGGHARLKDWVLGDPANNAPELGGPAAIGQTEMLAWMDAMDSYITQNNGCAGAESAIMSYHGPW